MVSNAKAIHIAKSHHPPPHQNLSKSMAFPNADGQAERRKYVCQQRL